MDTAKARDTLLQAGYMLVARPSKYFDSEIVLLWNDKAIGVLCERDGQVDVGEVEAFVRNAENAVAEAMGRLHKSLSGAGYERN